MERTFFARGHIDVTAAMDLLKSLWARMLPIRTRAVITAKSLLLMVFSARKSGDDLHLIPLQERMASRSSR